MFLGLVACADPLVIDVKEYSKISSKEKKKLRKYTYLTDDSLEFYEGSWINENYRMKIDKYDSVQLSRGTYMDYAIGQFQFLDSVSHEVNHEFGFRATSWDDNSISITFLTTNERFYLNRLSDSMDTVFWNRLGLLRGEFIQVGGMKLDYGLTLPKELNFFRVK